MHQLLYLKILYTIRENNNCISLKELLVKTNLYIGHTHNSAHHFFINLYNDGYIIFLNEEKKDVSSLLFIMDVNKILDFFTTYLHYGDEEIYVKLTDKLAKIQSLLGFSLRDTMIKFSYEYSTMATPFFNRPDISLQTDVFVIMPFKKEFDYIYKNQIRKVCEQNNLTCMRGDDIYSSKPIMQDIWSLIFNCKIIIADCTNKNPNVMYELGIAHTLGKKVILITQDTNDIPFDLRHLRHLHYEYTPHTISDFEDGLNLAIHSYLEDNSDDVF